MRLGINLLHLLLDLQVSADRPLLLASLPDKNRHLGHLHNLLQPSRPNLRNRPPGLPPSDKNPNYLRTLNPRLEVLDKELKLPQVQTNPLIKSLDLEYSERLHWQRINLPRSSRHLDSGNLQQRGLNQLSQGSHSGGSDRKLLINLPRQSLHSERLDKSKQVRNHPNKNLPLGHSGCPQLPRNH